MTYRLLLTALLLLGISSAPVPTACDGCERLYSGASPFNRRLPADPRPLAGSRELVTALLAQGPIPDLVVSPPPGADWYHPLYRADADDPQVRVHCTAVWGRCEVEGHLVRLPVRARPADSHDAHLAVLDRASGWEYDFWKVQGVRHGVLVVGWGGRTRLDGDGLGSDATAAHFGLGAGVIRAHEFLAGRIDHALFLVVGCTSASYVAPARGRGEPCPRGARGPATGQHLRLALSPAQIEALHLPDWKRAVVRALAEYGGFVGDTGAHQSLGVQLESGASWTSLGRPDPLSARVRALARQPDTGVRVAEDGSVRLDLASGLDWAAHLQVLDPCVSQRTC